LDPLSVVEEEKLNDKVQFETSPLTSDKDNI
jgi:ferrous-iron efflux pump FieF